MVSARVQMKLGWLVAKIQGLLLAWLVFCDTSTTTGRSCKVVGAVAGSMGVSRGKGRRCCPCCTWQAGLLVFKARLVLKG